jgi:hypothetical protein
MEPAGVAERLHGKTVLITGATGFIAKRNGNGLNLTSLLFEWFCDRNFDDSLGY